MKNIYIIIFISCFWSCKPKNNGSFFNVKNSYPEQVIHQKLNGKEIVTKLEKLNYFNLTDLPELEKVKTHFEKTYADFNFFQGPLRGETLNFMDNRFHWVDCEELFEVDGLPKYLTQVKTTFKKLELKLEFANEKSEQNQDFWKHTIELNGTEYTAYKGHFSNLDWGLSYINFIEMLNIELRKQSSNEQFYPINCGNDGTFVLLTPMQLKFINNNYPINYEHPTTIMNWKSKNGI